MRVPTSGSVTYTLYECQKWVDIARMPSWQPRSWVDAHNTPQTRESCVLPSTSWRWTDLWRVSAALGDVDDWEYAVDFAGPFSPKCVNL